VPNFQTLLKKFVLVIRQPTILLGTIRTVELILGRADVKEPLFALSEEAGEYVVNPVEHIHYYNTKKSHKKQKRATLSCNPFNVM